MRIPTSFKLFGRTITVEHTPILIHEQGANGLADYDAGKILLQSSLDHHEVSKELTEHVFLHELVHHVLFAAGEEEFDPPLHAREFLVDRIAGLLHQAITTAEYKELTQA